MSKQILKFFAILFAVIGFLTTAGKVVSVFQDYGKTFVVIKTEDYTEGMSGIMGIGSLHDNRSLVILKEERGYGAIRTLNRKMKDSFFLGDRVSFDLLGFPHRL